MAAVAHASSLEEIAAEACPYPAELLPQGGTGLCLFAAGFLGQNDAIHMWGAGMTVFLVDTDQERLVEMTSLYPPDWNLAVCDAWDFAQRWASIFRPSGSDVVSVDNFTGEIEPRVLNDLPLWCSLARRMVTVTLGNGATYEVPDGWQATTMRRSPLASWLVLTHA